VIFAGWDSARFAYRPLPRAELEELKAKGDYWNLGCLYAEGQGVAKDREAALRWYRMAAEQGEVWSQFSVGRFYMNGYGVQQDYKEAYF
jgi:TPR repeat protein